MNKVYTTAQISEQLRKAQAIAERVRMMRWRRANAASIKANLGGLGCQLHNSLVALHYGEPWREVDYHYARLANHLLETSFEPSRIIDRYYSRMIRDWRAAGCP